MRLTRREIIIQWAQILLGLMLSALGYRMFLIPLSIAPGGFTGIGQLVNAFTRAPVGVVALCLNVPLFAFSLKRMGLRFGLRSLFSSVALSFLLDALPVGAATDDPMLAALFGGAVAGAGFGLILRGEATTGGSDMLAKLVVKRVPILKVGAVTFFVDALVVVASGFVFDAKSAMLALIASFLMNRVMDAVIEGPDLAKAYFIISSRSDAIAARILEDLGRGVTGLRGKGMYSGEDKTVLLCVVSRFEAMRLRLIVSHEDPAAFMIATDAREALGEGFERMDP